MTPLAPSLATPMRRACGYKNVAQKDMRHRDSHITQRTIQ